MSTNEEITLENMISIKGLNKANVEKKVKDDIVDIANYAKNLNMLGFESYLRDVNNEMYKIEKSNNYYLGTDGGIYIIYAYGNEEYTTENDVIYIK